MYEMPHLQVKKKQIDVTCMIYVTTSLTEEKDLYLIRVCTHTHACTYIHIHAYMHTCIHAHTHTHTRTNTYTHTHTHTSTQ